tara:strand:+ start:102 stop:641 length:540 start_codon:yes stop_codon:yes gene_type:complete
MKHWDGGISMVNIETTCSLESFRRFLVTSTCLTFIPEIYLRDTEVFPEKEGESGSIYIEAADKVTLKKIRMISFINVRDVLGILYTSKSGNTTLKWRQTRGINGKATGEASGNTLVNLLESGMITKEYAEELVQSNAEKNEEHSFSVDDEDELLDENNTDSVTFEIPGLEGTLQTDDDV